MLDNLVVKKFGGTSVVTLEKIRSVAELLVGEVQKGKIIVVVVSAQAGFTDGMVSSLKSTVSSKHALGEELDVVLAAGEQISCGILAMLLRDMSINAKSFLGWQLPIMTTPLFGRAKVEEINVAPLMDFFTGGGSVAVVAGFQGMNKDHRITTLGRGGSDTSAVALAASMGVETCEIYTDVDGVFTTDPNIVRTAKKIDILTFEEMLEMSFLGSKIMHVRAVEVARLNNIRLHIMSTFGRGTGTLVVSNTEYAMDKNVVQVSKKLVTGVAHTIGEAGISLFGEDLSVIEVFGVVAEANVNVDMIAQTFSGHATGTWLTFTVPLSDVELAISAISGQEHRIKYSKLLVSEDVAKVSVVGVGMLSNPGVTYKALKALADNQIDVVAITTSEIKISVLVHREKCYAAVRVLHDAFELSQG